MKRQLYETDRIRIARQRIAQAKADRAKREQAHKGAALDKGQACFSPKIESGGPAGPHPTRTP